METEEQLSVDPFRVKFGGRAGEVLSSGGPSGYNSYEQELLHTSNSSEPENVWAPFTSQIDWEIAKWAKLRGPSSTAFSELLAIDGVSDALGLSYKNTRELNRIVDEQLPGRPRFKHEQVVIDNQAFDLFSRDIIQCIKDLWGNPEFASILVFQPEKHYTDDTRTTQLYHDMHTGQWWWNTQEQVENDNPGATIVPIIISSDKTQLTLFRNKSAYPVYLTIGNLPKATRTKPSRQGQVLLAYLPVTRLEHMPNKAARRRALANLFHGCLAHILEPLTQAGIHGIAMTTGDGTTYRCHPIFACFVGDYPEQMLTVCCKYGECPGCDIPHSELGCGELGGDRDINRILDALELAEQGGPEFTQACQEAGIKPIYHPFWQELPYVYIFESIVPDVLHQLLQGILKHILAWIKTAYSSEELDARCRRMPASHGMRLFTQGISTLNRISGSEHRQICSIILGLIVDLPLPHHMSPSRLIRAVRSILDFLYLAQYPCHSTHTLDALDDALNRFHANKSIFVDLGIRTHFNFPKLHFASHYRSLIERFGTTDNTNTETTERLHIDLTKDAYRATNKKDVYPQMTIWLERKEKILHHASFIQWRLSGTSVTQAQVHTTHLPRIHLTKNPSKTSVPFSDLENNYRAPNFLRHLQRYVAITNKPELTAAQSYDAAFEQHIPFVKVPVYHSIKFTYPDPHLYSEICNIEDTLHANPARSDVALIKIKDECGPGVNGYRAAQIRVIFKIPQKHKASLFMHDASLESDYLAYIEWFSPFRSPHPDHKMYRLSRSLEWEGTEWEERHAEVIPLSRLYQVVHLIPKFGPQAPREWTSSSSIEHAPFFYVNCFRNAHAYKTLF
ncbi:hypothetical protein PUNSTDRAFT_74727 [Punctularia strigosozonata HHB-11173 SS5]|uniref:uncharacterized protein n=1 Tax=Punctularia strigosozonata (strain HHB-11173) TaxID=741275 RepID=UPI000441829E|nr:uncharacterized protein PUNSTDRAFT_74727 [Punctularia strigosozonata HHB-11173 SS5]EIN05577.1 hypothetical protein PUNSTDRAFT_74727 [Punctularia strigosozonata HHB-11173 SS5]